MNYIFACLLAIFSIAFIHSESTKIQEKKQTTPDSETIIQAGLKFLNNKNILITLPSESGLRKDIYDVNGNLLESEFLNAKGKLVELDTGIAMEKRKYNSLGFLEKIQTFDKKKKITSTSLFAYDNKCLEIKKSQDCLQEISSFDSDKNPLEDENGIHKYKTEFDINCLGLKKNKTLDCKKLEVNLNKKTKLVEDKDGNAKIVRTFDDFGNLNLYEIYDQAGKIKHKVIYAYDYKCIELTNKPQGCIIFQEYSNRIENKSNMNNINY